MDIGARIKQLRQAAGWSQSELARRAGIGQSTLSYLESGEKDPSVSTLLRVCDALHISLPEFLGISESPVPPRLRPLLSAAQNLDNEALAVIHQLVLVLARQRRS